MQGLLIVLALLVTQNLFCQSALIQPDRQTQLKDYETKVTILYKTLTQDCPSYTKYKRETVKGLRYRVEVEKEFYEKLLALLVKCKGKEAANIFDATTQLPATSGKTTSNVDLPPACQTAKTVTEAWRSDVQGMHLKPYEHYSPPEAHSHLGYACDFHSSAQWFRFGGDAGTHMLDHCPKPGSCGTSIPYWTDEEVPKAIGVEATINVYGVGGLIFNDCKFSIRQVKVMRCSWDTSHDFIYKQTTNRTLSCDRAFCGMK